MPSSSSSSSAAVFTVRLVCFIGVMVGVAEFGRDPREKGAFVKRPNSPISKNKNQKINRMLQRIKKTEAISSRGDGIENSLMSKKIKKEAATFDSGENLNGVARPVKSEPIIFNAYCCYDNDDNNDGLGGGESDEPDEEAKIMARKNAVKTIVPKSEVKGEVKEEKREWDVDGGSDEEKRMAQQNSMKTIVPKSKEEEEDKEEEEEQWSASSVEAVDGWKRSEKLAIVNKFVEMRRDYKSRSDYRHQDCGRIEQKIVEKLGIGRRRIYQWKRELGYQQKGKPTEPKRATKMALIKQFEQMRKGIDRRARTRTENKIARQLGTYRHLIYQWKRELDMGKTFSHEQRHQIIKGFDKIKKEFSLKFKMQINGEIENKIAQKFGVKAKTIRNWKMRFGMPVTFRGNYYYSYKEKVKLVLLFDKLKQTYPDVSKTKIAKWLNISKNTITRWKAKLGIVSDVEDFSSVKNGRHFDRKF